MNTNTTTQRRAICPACFAEQATRNGRMVQHGYRRPQHWHSNVGTCSGTNHMHFGTPAGREYTASLAHNLRKAAFNTDQRSIDVINGTANVYATQRVARNVVQDAKVENPTQRQREQYANRLRHNATMMRESADELDAKVTAWTPRDVVEVEVESYAGPLLHFRGGYYNGKLCASSYMNSIKGAMTTDITKVTCAKCKARHAELEARKQEQA